MSNEQGGRDSKGRFQAGNTGGPGNPFGRRMAVMRQAIVNAVTDEEIAAVIRGLLAKAMEGDLAAITLYFQCVVGKPKSRPTVTRRTKRPSHGAGLPVTHRVKR